MTDPQRLREIAHRYLLENPEPPPTAHEIASWAVANGEWSAPDVDAVEDCAERIERALREDFIQDTLGRRVRTKHEVKLNEEGRPVERWADVRTAGQRFMEIAFRQRRERIAKECRQLKADLDSFNEARAFEDPIDVSFDFTPDVNR